MDHDDEISWGTSVLTCITCSGDPHAGTVVDSLGDLDLDLGLLLDGTVSATVGTLLVEGLSPSVTGRTLRDLYHLSEGRVTDHLYLSASSALLTLFDVSVTSSGTLTGLAPNGVGDLELELLTVEDVHQFDLHIVHDGISLGRTSARLAPSSAEEHVEQSSAEEIADVLEVREVVHAEPAGTELSVESFVTVLIVELTFVGVGEDLVGL